MSLSETAARRKDRNAKVVQMQHRHFAFIADIIRENALDDRTAEAFASRLADTNPNFNRSRFLAACED